MNVEKTGNHYVTWILRVLLIIMTIFIAILSFDGVDFNQSFWDTFLVILERFIPTIALIVILIVAWKRENIGGVLLMLSSIGFIIFLYYKIDDFMIGTYISVGIPFLIGALFVVNHYYLGGKQETN